MRGKIKFYNVAKRFGFITADDGGEELYFTESALPRDRRYDPNEGDLVEFEARDTTNKPNRVAVRIVIDLDGIQPYRHRGGLPDAHEGAE